MLFFNQVDIRVNKRQLLQIDELELKSGVIGLVGRNGSGKSTFLRTIMGEHAEYSGSISLNGKLLADLSGREMARQLAIVYTKPALFGAHSVREVLALGRIPYQNIWARMTKKDEEVILDKANLLGLSDYLDRPFTGLSDGEKQLVMIGRALTQDTPVVLLDEPGAFLDVVNRHLLMGLLRKIAEETNKLVLFSTHLIDPLEETCDNVLLIHNQKIERFTDKSQFKNEITRAFEL